MLTMRGRNSIWWPPTANCGIERLGLEATPTWPAVVLLAGYDPHYSVLQPGSVSRSGLRPPSDHSIIKLWHNYQWHGIRAHQGTSTAHIPQDHSGHLSWHPTSPQPAPKDEAKQKEGHYLLCWDDAYCHCVASVVFFWYLWDWSECSITSVGRSI